MTVKEVRRPVQGVDDPERAPVPASDLSLYALVALLREDQMLRVPFLDDRERRLLGVEVGLRHVVCA